MDKNLVDEKFLEYSTLDKIRSLFELFHELKNGCSINKILGVKRNVIVDKIISKLEEILKVLDQSTDQKNKEELKGECFEAIDVNDYIIISSWLLELIEQDFYEHFSSLSLLKDYIKILNKYKV